VNEEMLELSSLEHNSYVIANVTVVDPRAGRMFSPWRQENYFACIMPPAQKCQTGFHRDQEV
jgi:hypothetical protein